VDARDGYHSAEYSYPLFSFKGCAAVRRRSTSDELEEAIIPPDVAGTISVSIPIADQTVVILTGGPLLLCGVPPCQHPLEPVTRQHGNLIECARFFEQMAGSWDNLNMSLRRNCRSGASV
jgi:hypothetical protein